jgi:hypothetical protein
MKNKVLIFCLFFLKTTIYAQGNQDQNLLKYW